MTVFVFGITGRDYIMSHKFLSVVLPLGGMTGIIVGVRSYFKGVGPMLSTLAGIVGALTSYIPIYILSMVQRNSPDLFDYTVAGITVVYMLLCHLTAFKEGHAADAAEMRNLLKNDDVKSTQLEPLYYTFKTKSHRYKSSKFGLLDELSDHVNSLSGESVMHYVLWSVLALVMLLEFCLFSSSIFDVKLP